MAAAASTAPAVVPSAPPAAASTSRLYRFLSARWWLAFILLGASFALFGVASLNLVQMLSANFEFLGRYGFVAVREGGLTQLVELVLSGYAAALFYLLFKLCEKVLVDRLSTSRPPKRGA
jgi:hypothetical protein